MKRIIMIGLAAFFAAGLFSCNNNNNDNINLAPPKSDTVTKGSYLQLSFNSKNFYISDLMVNNSPIYTLSATTIPSDIFDTLWSVNIVQKDFKMKQIALNITASNKSDTGTYSVNTNGSTLTDYSTGQNKNYTIVTGSTVHITQTNNYFIQGELSLNLRYNFDSTTSATGNFKVFK